MTQPKHTPGPWRAINKKSIYPGNSSFWITGGEGSLGIVAVVHYVEPHGESYADARLISAAPDLLAALTDLIEEHTSIVHSEYDGTSKLLTKMLNTRAMKAARAAIAKATNNKP